MTNAANHNVPVLAWMLSSSFMWTFMCSLRDSERLNALSHSRHLYGFSPLWILLCLTRWRDTANRFLQTVHSNRFSREWGTRSNGFSCEWLRWWSLNAPLFIKHIPHSVHLYLPLWTFIWYAKYRLVVKLFSHWVHEYIFSSPLCISLCWIKWHFSINRLSQTVHTYGLGLSLCSVTSASVLFPTQLPAYAQHNRYTFVRFLSTVNSTVFNKMTWHCKSFTLTCICFKTQQHQSNLYIVIWA